MDTPSRSSLHARGWKSTGKTRDVLSCCTYGFIVLLSWFANERRSLTLSTSMIEGDLHARCCSVEQGDMPAKRAASILATMYRNFDGAFSAEYCSSASCTGTAHEDAYGWVSHSSPGLSAIAGCSEVLKFHDTSEWLGPGWLALSSPWVPILRRPSWDLVFFWIAAPTHTL